MKEIKLRKVGMNNFGPYKQPLVYDIEDKKLTLITGPNGIGKTMSLEAIPYTLYGVTSKGSKGDDVVNNVVGKNCHTWVELEIGDNSYKIERFQKHSKHGNNVVVIKDDSVIKRGQKEVLPFVESEIMPRKLFMNTLMFAQKIKDFFTDLADSDKKEVFRLVLNLDKYTEYYETTKKLIEEITSNFKSIEQKKEMTEFKISEMEKAIKEELRKKNEFEESKTRNLENSKKSLENNKKLKEFSEKEILIVKKKVESLENFESVLKVLETEIKLAQEEHKLKLSEYVVMGQEKEKEIRSTNSKMIEEIIKEYDDLLEDLNKKFEDMKKEADLELSKLNKSYGEIMSSNRVNKSLLGQEIEKHDKLKKSLEGPQKTCPTCLQPLSEKSQKEVENLIDQHIKNISLFKEKINEELENSIQLSIKQLEEKTTERLKIIKQKYQELKNEKTQKISNVHEKTETVLKQIKTRMQEITSKLEEELEVKINDKRSKINELKLSLKELDSAKKELQKLESLIFNYEVAIKNIQDTISNLGASKFDDTLLLEKEKALNEDKDNLKTLAENLNKYSEEMAILLFWKQAFSPSGIPSMLIDEAIPFMNKKVSEYLDKISNGRYIVSFDTISTTKSGEFRDKINVNVLDTYSKANQRTQLSGGQTRIVDIATILTLGDLQSTLHNVKFNFLIFDEIFDSLDEENISNVSKILRQLSSERSLFIISHRHVDQLEVDSLYNFGQGGISGR